MKREGVVLHFCMDTCLSFFKPNLINFGSLHVGLFCSIVFGICRPGTSSHSGTVIRYNTALFKGKNGIFVNCRQSRFD